MFELTIEFVSSIRNTELLLGDGVKRMTKSEAKNITGIRRSIVSTRKIIKGTPLSLDMLACKRLGIGLMPDDMDKIVGLKVNQNISESVFSLRPKTLQAFAGVLSPPERLSKEQFYR